MTNDPKPGKTSEEQQTVEQLIVAAAVFETVVGARIGALEIENAQWQAIARNLALTNPRQALDTPTALQEEEWALWKAHLEPAPQRPGKKHIQELIGQRQVDTEQQRQQTLQQAKSRRDLHKEVLHRAIAQFVATAKKEAKYASDHHNPLFRGKPWSSGKIIKEAMRIFGVRKRTIDYAVADYPEDLHFVDKNGSKPVASATK
jgi:hypothetical protein